MISWLQLMVLTRKRCSTQCSPAIGIGCNMAIQDDQALNDALESVEGDIKAALEKFNNIRHEQVKECQQLEKFVFASFGDQKGINQLLLLLAIMHDVYHFVGNRYLPHLVSETVALRFSRQDISAKEALQILQLELASLLVVFANVFFGTYKAVAGVL